MVKGTIYEKIGHIHPWITWYIRPGHVILCLGNLNLIRYITHMYLIKTPFKYYISILGGVGGLRPCLFCLFRGGGVQNSGKPTYAILPRSLIYWSRHILLKFGPNCVRKRAEILLTLSMCVCILKSLSCQTQFWLG